MKFLTIMKATSATIGREKDTKLGTRTSTTCASFNSRIFVILKQLWTLNYMWPLLSSQFLLALKWLIKSSLTVIEWKTKKYHTLGTKSTRRKGSGIKTPNIYMKRLNDNECIIDRNTVYRILCFNRQWLIHLSWVEKATSLEIQNRTKIIWPL